MLQFEVVRALHAQSTAGTSSRRWFAPPTCGHLELGSGLRPAAYIEKMIAGLAKHDHD